MPRTQIQPHPAHTCFHQPGRSSGAQDNRKGKGPQAEAPIPRQAERPSPMDWRSQHSVETLPSWVTGVDSSLSPPSLRFFLCGHLPMVDSTSIIQWVCLRPSMLQGVWSTLSGSQSTAYSSHSDSPPPGPCTITPSSQPARQGAQEAEP